MLVMEVVIQLTFRTPVHYVTMGMGMILLIRREETSGISGPVGLVIFWAGG